LAIFASLQWGLSGRAVKLASTSQELLDLFEALAPLENEMVVPTLQHGERGDPGIRYQHKRRFRAYKLIRVAARASGRCVIPKKSGLLLLTIEVPSGACMARQR
jgi:hypothetical protein